MSPSVEGNAGNAGANTVQWIPGLAGSSRRVDEVTSIVLALMETVNPLIFELFASLVHESSLAEGASHLQQAQSQWRSKLR